MRRLLILVSFVLAFPGIILIVAQSSMASPIAVGDSDPGILNFSFPAPSVLDHRVYLDLDENQDVVLLQESKKDYSLIEIVGVYCPVCHNQAPDMLRLYQRIRRDAQLSDRVGMFSVAAGATPMEVEHLHRAWRFPFPILQDPEYALHKLIGEPDTPFTLILARDGTVLYAHLGRIDPDKLFSLLKQLP